MGEKDKNLKFINFSNTKIKGEIKMNTITTNIIQYVPEATSKLKSLDQINMSIFDSIHQNSKIMYYDAVLMKISVFLNKIGIKPQMKGFKYIRMAIQMTIEDESNLDAITKTIYPAVAKKYNTNWMAVERCMRTVIGKAEESDFMNETFYGADHFSNKEFIALASEYITTLMK